MSNFRHLAPLYDLDGVLSLLIGLADAALLQADILDQEGDDIDERRRIDLRLANADKRLRQSVEALRDALALCDERAAMRERER